MLTDDEIAAIEARAEAAEARPWSSTGAQESKQFGHVPACVRHVWQADDGRHTLFVAECNSYNTDNDANAAFIAAARQDVPALLADRRELVALARELASTRQDGDLWRHLMARCRAAGLLEGE